MKRRTFFAGLMGGAAAAFALPKILAEKPKPMGTRTATGVKKALDEATVTYVSYGVPISYTVNKEVEDMLEALREARERQHLALLEEVWKD